MYSLTNLTCTPASSMTQIQISSSNGSVGGFTESPGFYDSANGIVAIPVGGPLTTYSYNALIGRGFGVDSLESMRLFYQTYPPVKISKSLVRNRIYLIKYNGKRTTVSINATLFRLLAMRLGSDPTGEEAWDVVKKCVQDEVDQGQFHGTGLSQEISTRIIYTIADPNIFRKGSE